MKKIILIVLVIINCGTLGKLIAQTLTWGNTLNSNSSVYRPHIFGEDKEAIYSISYERGKVMFEKFNKTNWEKAYSNQIVANYSDFSDDAESNDGKEKSLEIISYFNNQFVVFTSDFDKENNLYRLYASIYDAKNGEKIKENIEVTKVPVESFKRKGGFGFLISKNEKYIFIHHYAYHKKRKVFETHNIVIDANLEILVDKKETENRDENNYRIYNFLIDNEGSFYYAKRYSASETYIVSYDANKDYEKWEEKINIEDLKTSYTLSHITFSINDKNDILISGFYDYLSDKALKYPGTVPAELAGCFFMKVDNYSKEFTINKISTFSDDFLKSFRTKKQIKKDQAPYIPDQLNITQILNKKDGGIILIGENYYYMTYKNGYIEYFNDIVIVNLSEKGEILWEKRIKKQQAFTVFMLKSMNRTKSQRRYFSYLAGLGEKELMIFYNDKPENIGRPLSEEYEYCKLEAGAPIMATINLETGNMETKIIDELQTAKMHLIPMENYQAYQGADIILLAQEGKEYKFGILKFK